MGAAAAKLRDLRAGPLDASECAELKPVWGPFVDTFVATLHAQGAAVAPVDVDERTPRSPATPSAAHASTSTSYRRPSVERLVAIGDVHGDLAKTREAFRAAKLTNARDEWVGGTTTCVQVGDQLDRGKDEVAILHFLERLRGEARAAGGELVVMNGNHETLNVSGRYRYSLAEGNADFTRWRARQDIGKVLRANCGLAAGVCESRAGEAAKTDTLPSFVKEGEGDRWRALAPGAPLALRFLAHQPVVVAIGSTLFVHGGVLPEHVKYGLDTLNEEISQWIKRGKIKSAPPLSVQGRDSVVWARDYSHVQEHKCDCDLLEETLRMIPGVERVVVGHTIQHPHGITSACDGKVIRIDVGMSKGCVDAKPEELEILKDGESIAKMKLGDDGETVETTTL